MSTMARKALPLSVVYGWSTGVSRVAMAFVLVFSSTGCGGSPKSYEEEPDNGGGPDSGIGAGSEEAGVGGGIGAEAGGGPDSGIGAEAGGDESGTDSGGGPVTCGDMLESGVSTLAGSSESGDADGSRCESRFWNPVNVAYRNGKVYVADFDNGKLRAIDALTHVTSSISTPSNFQQPFGLAFASDEMLYVTTDINPDGLKSETTGTIWRFDLVTVTAEVVASDVGRPRGLVVLPDGRVVATDFLHHVVEVFDPQSGQPTIITGAWDESGLANGDGAAARFNRPYGIGLRSDGKLVVADNGNHVIRLVDLDGTASVLAGTGNAGFSDGPVASAQFNGPLGVSVAANGDVFVTDTDNYRIRRISGGQVTTVAGSGQPGYADNADPLAAQLYGLEGLSVTPDGSVLYVADGNRGEDDPYNRIRQVRLF